MVETQITDFVKRRFLFSDGTITPADSLLDSGLVDSAGIFELVSFLESEFGIEVRDEEIAPENFETVGSIAAFVGSKRAS